MHAECSENEKYVFEALRIHSRLFCDLEDFVFFCFFSKKTYILDHSESIDIEIKNNKKIIIQESEFADMSATNSCFLLLTPFLMLYSLFKLLWGEKLNLYERKNIS